MSLESLSLATLDLEFEHPYCAIHDRVFGRKGIRRRKSQTLSAQLAARPSIHQDVIDAYLLARFMQAAFEY